MRLALVACVLAIGCKYNFDRPIDGAPSPIDAVSCSVGPFVSDLQGVPTWASRYQIGGSAVVVANGEVYVDLGTEAADSAAGIFSSTFQLAELRIAIDASVAISANARAYMCMSDCNGGPLEDIGVQTGMIHVESASQGGVIARRIYDPLMDRFWQLREHAGTTFWETSPDGAAWNTLTSLPTPPIAQTAQLWLGAWNNGDANAGTARYSQFESCLEP